MDPRAAWLVDLGATSHYVKDRNLLYQVNDIDRWVELGDQSKVKANLVGKTDLTLYGLNKILYFVITDCIYLQSTSHNIISPQRLLDSAGFTFKMRRDYLHFYLKVDPLEKLVFAAIRIRNLYWMPVSGHLKLCDMSAPIETMNIALENHLKRWHMKLGHVHKQRLINLIIRGDIIILQGNKVPKWKDLNACNLFCKTCALTKARRRSYGDAVNDKTDLAFHTVHMDTMGPMETSGVLAVHSLNGGYRKVAEHKYVLTIIDDATAYRWTFILKSTKEVFFKVQELLKVWDRQNGGKAVKRLRTDGGKEFVNERFDHYCKDEGIIHQTSNVVVQEENGSAERAQQTLMASVRVYLRQAGLAARYWPEALLYATYVNNRLPSRRLGEISPYEALHGVKPDLAKLVPWGISCYAYIPVPSRKPGKFDTRATEARVIGISTLKKAYKLMDKETGKVFDSGDIRIDDTAYRHFLSKSFPEHSTALTKGELESISELGLLLGTYNGVDDPSHLNSDNVGGNVIETSDQTEIEAQVSQEDGNHSNTSQGVIVRKSSRVRTSNVRLGDYLKLNKAKDQNYYIPSNIFKARECQDWALWQEAIAIELGALKSNRTWVLVPPPKGRRVLRNMWLFSVKENANGSIERYKARLVVMGNDQKYGYDYQETFAPVVRYESLRLMLALAAKYDFVVHQMDVKTAFLNGEIDADIYMKQPQGYREVGERSHYVCKVLRSLYGLKQAPRIWYVLMTNFLMELGFVRTKKDYCLFFKRGENGKLAYICLYVDDLTILGSQLALVSLIKSDLAKEFIMTDLGPIHFILKMEIKRNLRSKLISISQRKYILDLCQQYGITEGVSTPEAQKVLKPPISANGKWETFQCDYRSLVGSLVHVVKGTRPDVANAVRNLSKFLHNYGKEQWKAALRVLKYLKQTNEYGLIYCGNNQLAKFELYSDASFGNPEENLKSVTGYVTIMSEAAITWKCVRQPATALFTAEAELSAASEGIRESEWLWFLLDEMGFTQSEPIKHWVDNMAAIAIIMNRLREYYSR